MKVAEFWKRDLGDATYLFETKLHNCRLSMVVATHHISGVMRPVSGYTGVIPRTYVARKHVHVEKKTNRSLVQVTKLLRTYAK